MVPSSSIRSSMVAVVIVVADIWLASAHLWHSATVSGGLRKYVRVRCASARSRQAIIIIILIEGGYSDQEAFFNMFQN